jgi:hypothetical protein
MALSDKDRRRIDEEEYRKLSRERLERTERIEAEIRTSGDQRLEVPDRDVGAQLYNQWKGDAKGSATVIQGIVKAVYRDAKPVISVVLLVISGFLIYFSIAFTVSLFVIPFLDFSASEKREHFLLAFLMSLPGAVIVWFRWCRLGRRDRTVQ